MRYMTVGVSRGRVRVKGIGGEGLVAAVPRWAGGVASANKFVRLEPSERGQSSNYQVPGGLKLLYQGPGDLIVATWGSYQVQVPWDFTRWVVAPGLPGAIAYRLKIWGRDSCPGRRLSSPRGLG